MSFVRSILIVFCVLISFSVRANDVDKLICFTDREVYASGDQILLRLFLPAESTSKVVYVDLSDFSGNHISGVKLAVENHLADGYLTIPDSVRTGTYLLRSFVNLNQRREFFIRDLLIANRFEDFSSGLNVPIRKLLNEKQTTFTDDLILSIPEIIKRRENVQLKLTVSSELMSQLKDSLIISISTYIDQFHSNEKYFIQEAGISDNIISEDKGIVISGKVTDKNSQLPVSNATVFLSIPDSIPGFQYAFTNNDGSFNLLLKDMYGQMPVVIQAVEKNEELKLTLNEKFKLNLPEFHTEVLDPGKDLDDQLIQTVESRTFRKIFGEDVVPSKLPVTNFKNDLLFYGEPTYKVVPGQFFNLRDFSEISRELLSGVKLRDKNGKLSLNISDKETNNYFEEQAFVLIDGIPVQDLNILRNMGTSKIEWIHTVLDYRFFGDITFPGIVAISTGDYKLKWLNGSDRLIKLDFQALQIKENKIQPKIARKAPDLRPVLLWQTARLKPELQFDFKTSDSKGDFRIRVAGKKKNGETVVSEKIFHVN